MHIQQRSGLTGKVEAMKECFCNAGQAGFELAQKGVPGLAGCGDGLSNYDIGAAYQRTCPTSGALIVPRSLGTHPECQGRDLRTPSVDIDSEQIVSQQ